MGALVSAMVGYSISLPPVIHTVFALLCGGLGAAWALVPAYLKMKFGINEIVNTLMLNYVASLFTELVRVFALWVHLLLPCLHEWLLRRLPLLQHCQTMRLTKANIGLVLGIFMAVALYTFFRRTVKSYEIGRLPAGIKLCQYGGVDVKKLTFPHFLPLDS